MAQATTTNAQAAWVDLASADAAASRDFYAQALRLAGRGHPDPQYGGYGIAKIGGKDVAGIGPKKDPECADRLVGLYIGTDDIEGLAAR